MGGLAGLGFGGSISAHFRMHLNAFQCIELSKYFRDPRSHWLQQRRSVAFMIWWRVKRVMDSLEMNGLDIK